jgi:hypothetical protein
MTKRLLVTSAQKVANGLTKFGLKRESDFQTSPIQSGQQVSAAQISLALA